MYDTKENNCELSTINDSLKEDSPKDDGEHLDYVFEEIGEFSVSQIRKYILICIPIALSAIYAIGFVVTGSSLEYRCRIPECDLPGSSAVYAQPWLEQAIPFENNRLRKCLRYKTNVTIAMNSDSGKCPAQLFDKTAVIPCNDFVFKTNERRLIQEFGIYCEENEYKLALVGTINNVGCFLSMPFTGFLSDKFGRLTVLVIGMTANSIFGIMKAFVPNYYLFLLFEFADAAAGTCTYMAAFVLSVEWVSTKYRVLSCTIVSLFYPLGEMLLGILAMQISSMRTLLLVMYLPGLFVAFYYWLIPESVRWLVVTGRRKRALITLRIAAKANGKELSDKSESIINEKCKEALLKSEDDGNSTIPITAIFKSKVLALRLLNCSICWIVCVHVFYGMSVSATKIDGDDNKYLSFILVVFAEIPASIITYLLSDRLGRKQTLFVGLTVAGLAAISSPFVPLHLRFLKRILFFIGMCSISVAFSMLYIFTAEIWPTPLRNTLMNVCSMIGRIGAMAAPLTPLLVYVFPSLPFIAYGGTAILTAFLILTLPETLNKKLPDTIQETIDL